MALLFLTLVDSVGRQSFGLGMAQPEDHQKEIKNNRRDHLESRELLDRHNAQQQLDRSNQA